MRRLKAIVSYKGTNYKGFQRQPDLKTVQGELEKAIKLVTGEELTLTSAGRTDAGVHALGQVINFNTISTLTCYALKMLINRNLPNDIQLLDIEEVDANFSSRFDAINKTYYYRFYSSKNKLPLIDEQSLQVKFDIDISKMNQACKYIVGKHDFKSFQATGSIVKTSVREVSICYIEKISNNEYQLVISGRSFLYNMVRIIMGVLLKVGNNSLTPEQVKEIILSKERPNTKTVSPRGLTLISVEY